MDRATKHTPETNKESGCQNRSGQGSASPRLCRLPATHSKGTATRTPTQNTPAQGHSAPQKNRFFAASATAPAALHPPASERGLPTADHTCSYRQAAATQCLRGKAPRPGPDPREGAIHGAGEARGAAKPHRTLEQLIHSLILSNLGSLCQQLLCPSPRGALRLGREQSWTPVKSPRVSLGGTSQGAGRLVTSDQLQRPRPFAALSEGPISN